MSKMKNTAATATMSPVVKYTSTIERIKLWECRPFAGKFHNPRQESLDATKLINDLKASKLWAPAENGSGELEYPIVHPLADGKGFEVIRGHRRQRALLALHKAFTVGNDGQLVEIKDADGVAILVEGVLCRVITSELTDAQKLSIVADPTDTRKVALTLREKFSLYKQCLEAGFSSGVAFEKCGYGQGGNPLFSDLIGLGPKVQKLWHESFNEGRKNITAPEIRSLAKKANEYKKANPGKVDLPKEVSETIDKLANGKPVPVARYVSPTEFFDQILKPLAEAGESDFLPILALVSGREYDSKNRVFNVIDKPEGQDPALAKLVAWRQSLIKQ